LASAGKLKHRAKVHFHAGTFETVAEVVLLGRSEILAGQNGLAQLRFQDEVLLASGDRFIVRQFSPVTTIGGGVVLDALARKAMLRDTGRVKYLEILESGQRAEILTSMTERSVVGLSLEEIAIRTGWTKKEIRESAKLLEKAGKLKVVAEDAPVLIPANAYEDMQKKVLEKVERFQKENPLLPGIARQDLRTSLGRRVRAETFGAALDELVAAKKLEVQGDIVKKAGSGIELSTEEAKAKEQIEAAFAKAGLAVPAVKEVLAGLPVEAKRAEKLLFILLREKSLVRVTPELIFHRTTLAHLKELLSTYKKTKGAMLNVPLFKELTGITRKYAIPLLEYLDRERVTRRAGEERVIL
jgi:selenocysteine-specific elongation factor